MRYVLFLLFMLSSGCVLNQPQNFYYTEVHNSNVSNVSRTSTTTTKETPAPKPKTVVIRDPVQTTTTTCAEFVLPPKGPVPPTPVFSDPELKVKVDIDAILAAHIKALNKYADRERARVVTAYREWKDSCR
uniref:Uncharacterized protein n=1 Tax=Pseudomonas phage RVTF4 TaxID=3236931 RepID=A0AB39CD63_9VIRU